MHPIMEKAMTALPSKRSEDENHLQLLQIFKETLIRTFDSLTLEDARIQHCWRCYCFTGDAGYYDEDGRLYVADRLKQMIKCMGNQVVPAELEELLMQEHSDVIAEVSVIGLPHPEYGEAAAAAVVLTEEGRGQDLEDLAKRIKATIAGTKIEGF
ncbi:hypothetical protein HPB48_001591 [Haemaphysalis longicornis]|uniref:AMP-binding enzyme C-terminal domain-containing protein n=1 Tax=Haemaphysalis longicornis TaxID=44386 RepID=A0A9J6GD62_HAELO|nr:hypothetical protein HPB48_001591 [Haemaphysalis longicornis]